MIDETNESKYYASKDAVAHRTRTISSLNTYWTSGDALASPLIFPLPSFEAAAPVPGNQRSRFQIRPPFGASGTYAPQYPEIPLSLSMESMAPASYSPPRDFLPAPQY